MGYALNCFVMQLSAPLHADCNKLPTNVQAQHTSFLWQNLRFSIICIQSYLTLIILYPHKFCMTFSARSTSGVSFYYKLGIHLAHDYGFSRTGCFISVLIKSFCCYDARIIIGQSLGMVTNFQVALQRKAEKGVDYVLNCCYVHLSALLPTDKNCNILSYHWSNYKTSHQLL